MGVQREAFFGLMFAFGLCLFPREVAGGRWGLMDIFKREPKATATASDGEDTEGSAITDLMKSGGTIGAAEGCTSQLDICFLVDSSGSIGEAHYEEVKQFLHAFLSKLPIGNDEVNTSLVIFSTTVHPHWSLRANNASDKETAMQDVLTIPYHGGTTNTAAGLQTCNQMLFDYPREERQTVPKLVIAMTDGESDSDFHTVNEAKVIRERGGIITVLSVGMYVNHNECRSMCGCRNDSSPCPLYLQTEWSQLLPSISPILKEVCKTLPKDAVCSEWSEWSPCSATCGVGTQGRTRQQLSPPAPGTPTCPDCIPPMGRSCEEQGGVKENRSCDAGTCSVDAGCGTWGLWSEWSSSCGAATRQRVREGYNQPPPQGDGLLCEQQQPPVERSQTEQAQFAPCVVIPPTPPEWSAWSECTATCGGGTRHRSRNGLPPGTRSADQNTEQKPESNPWPGFDLHEQESCNNSPCPINATCGDFGEWSECSVSCGGGLSQRSRDPWNNDQQHGGKSCMQQYPNGHTEKRSCNAQPCPVDEEPGDWEEWGECNVTCGQGERTRRRGRSVILPQYGGRSIVEQNKSLPENEKILLVETETCSLPPCDASCTFPWSDWSSCEQCEAGTGTQYRNSAVKFDYRNKPCDLPTFQTQSCDCGETVPVPAPPPSEQVTPSAPYDVPERHEEREKNAGDEEPKSESEGVPVAAIAGGIVGGLILLGAAGGGAYYYFGGGKANESLAEMDFDVDSGATKVVMEEEKETLVPVDDDSDMWMGADH